MHPRSFEELSPEERARVEAFRACRRTPEARSRERADREAVRSEFPPAKADAGR